MSLYGYSKVFCSNFCTKLCRQKLEITDRELQAKVPFSTKMTIVLMFDVFKVFHDLYRV
jgi:hypothetical protein